jgi:hypothetical protein
MENEMDEGLKRTLGVIAAIFACRKLSALDGGQCESIRRIISAAKSMLSRGHLNQAGKDTAMQVHLFRCIDLYCGFEKGDNRDC